MDDTALVGRFKRVGDLFRNAQRFVDGQSTVVQSLGEGVAVDEFHNERANAGAFFDAVYGGDIRMIECRERLCLAVESSESVRIGREHIGKNFDCDMSIEARVAGAIHLTHSTGAYRANDFVQPEASTGIEWHWL